MKYYITYNCTLSSQTGTEEDEAWPRRRTEV